MPEIGEIFTTTKSGITGIVREIVENSSGSFRIRLETEDGSEKWTTLVPQ
jgi:hypothetical protein